MALKVLFILGCVLCVIRCNAPSSEVSSVSTSSDCTTSASDSFGYELLLTKLEDLEGKFWTMWIEMKEQNEQILRNHSRLENTHQGMMWMLTAVGHNLTTVMDRSWEILQQQVSCANHDNWKQSVLAMVQKPSKCSKQSNQQLVVDQKSFKSCSEAPANVSGKYMIQPLGFDHPLEAYCEQEAFGGGWLVMQYRFNGSVDFYRNWTEYRNGFGSLDGEFWLGLETLHRVTKEGNYVLMVELKDYEGNYYYARYDGFEIGSEDDKYSLKKFDTYSGTAGDSLDYHKKMKFSTMDVDNDVDGSRSCAQTYKGAWWYKECLNSNLNGLYQKGSDPKHNVWYHAKSKHDGLKYSRMMVREV